MVKKVKGKIKSRVKCFRGSKPSSFYDEDYYLRGKGSNYGSTDKDGNLLFSPYDEASYLPRNRELAKFLCQVYKPKTVLVLGCARAYLVQAFAELGVATQGIDISEWAINHAPSTVKECLHVGDICDLTRFKTDMFDLVTAFDVFEHIKVPDLYVAIKEAQRVCKHTLVVDVPTSVSDAEHDQSAGQDKSHVSVYSLQWWTRQLAIERGSWVLDAKDVYTYPNGSGGAMLIYRKYPALKTTVKQKQKQKQCEDVISNVVHDALAAGKHDVVDGAINDCNGGAKVDVVMINYNGLKYTPAAVESLYKNTSTPFRLFIVDNQSTDGSQDYLAFAQRGYPDLKAIFSPTLNSGFADGVNQALKYCTGEYVLLVNNDMLFPANGWLSKLVQVLDYSPDVGLASPKLLYPNGKIQYAGGVFTEKLEPTHRGRHRESEDAEFNTSRDVAWATFACVLIRRSLILDGLDEAYRIGYFEDVDCCLRLRVQGYKIRYVPSAVVYHFEGASTLQLVNPVHLAQQQRANAELFRERWLNWLRMNKQATPEVYS